MGQIKANDIKSRYYGGGEHSCLEQMLVLWYDSTDHNRNWETIVDALREIGVDSVIDTIEDNCLKW